MSQRICISRICLRKTVVQKASNICGIKYVLDSDYSTHKKYPLAVPVKIEYITTNFLSIFATFDNELI